MKIRKGDNNISLKTINSKCQNIIGKKYNGGENKWMEFHWAKEVHFFEMGNESFFVQRKRLQL